MALWDNLSKKASETTAKAAQQMRVLSETSRLNGLISDEEKKINNSYYQIGKLYAAMHQSDCEEEFGGMIAAITESEQKIKEYRMQIQEIKGVIRCEKCGAEVPNGAAFCSSCGSTMPKIQVSGTTDYVKCENCGADVKKGMRFCTSCGKPMEVVTAPVKMEAVVEATAEKICSNCGAKIEGDLAFCTECGTKL